MDADYERCPAWLWGPGGDGYYGLEVQCIMPRGHDRFAPDAGGRHHGQVEFTHGATAGGDRYAARWFASVTWTDNDAGEPDDGA